ncbi:MAG: aldose 1-epimerase [Thermoflavifilum sp.]|nr:aldose 1-epimerase [Thermoflavifilum sp.]MCL6512980.1 aldose 1-epimerase [Alicyclobacillus sp.]
MSRDPVASPSERNVADSRPRVQHDAWDGEAVIILRAGGDEAYLAPRLGGQLYALRHAQTVDLLYSPASPQELRIRPFHVGTPVLFPPGRVAGGEFVWGGRTYRWPRNDGGTHHLHGFVYDAAWDVSYTDTEDAARVELVLDAAPEHPAAKAFGHPFRLTLDYELRAGSLRCRLMVHNPGQDPFPLAAGFHPYFCAGPDTVVTVPAAAQWQLDQLIPTGGREATPRCAQLRSGVQAQTLALDDVFSALPDEDGMVRCHIAHPDIGLTLEMSWAAADFPFLVLFSGETGSPFFSIEPYSWVPNAPNLSLPPTETGMAALAPGEQRTYAWQLHWTALERT